VIEGPFSVALQAILVLEESELKGIVPRSQIGQADAEEPRAGPASASQFRQEFSCDSVDGRIGFKRLGHRP